MVTERTGARPSSGARGGPSGILPYQLDGGVLDYRGVDG